jgi:hypothetical protein
MIFATTHHLLAFDLTIALDPISCCKKNVYCRYMYRQYMNNMLCLVFLNTCGHVLTPVFSFAGY